MCLRASPRPGLCRSPGAVLCTEHPTGWEPPRDRAVGTQEVGNVVVVAAWWGRDAPLKCFLFPVLGGVGWDVWSRAGDAKENARGCDSLLVFFWTGESRPGTTCVQRNGAFGLS